MAVALANPAHGAEARVTFLLFPGWVRDIGAGFVLFGLTALFYWRILTPNPLNRGSFPKGDFVEQFYAFALFRAREISQGHIPLWNPYVYSGHPFVADIQAGVFYPLSWITTWLAAPSGYPFFALELEAIGHIFLAGLWMYFLASRVSGNRVAGIIGGIVYAFGGYLSAYPSQQLSVLEVHTWLPLALYWIFRATGTAKLGGRISTALTIVGGLTLGLAILAGHPQASLYAVYGTGSYFLFRIFARTGLSGWKQALRLLYLPVLFFVTAFGTAAVQLLPTIEFMGVSSRIEIPYEMSGWAFPLRDIMQIVLPGSVSLYSPMYVGILPLILAVSAVVWRRMRETGFWASLAVAGLLISFGGNTILHSIMFNGVPGFSTFRHQERGVVLFSASMAVLASIGAAELLGAGEGRLRRFSGLLFRGLIASIAVFVALYAQGLGLEKTPQVQNTAAFLVILMTLTTQLTIGRRWFMPAPVFAVLLVAIAGFDLITSNWQINYEKTLPGDQYRPTEIVKYLQKNDQNGRTYNDWQYPLNYGDVFKVRDINGASPLVVERYRKLYNAEPKSQVWRVLGVKYFLTWQGGFPGGEKISVEKLDAEREVNLYGLPDPLPRAYVAHSAVVVQDEEEALRTVLSSDVDPGNRVVLASAPGVQPSGAQKRSAATVTDLSTERIRVDATLLEPGILVLSEVFYPGWKATVDGVPSDILRAQYALRGVALPAGNHQVDFVFDPVSLKVGAAVSAVTLLAAVAGALALALGWRKPV